MGTGKFRAGGNPVMNYIIQSEGEGEGGRNTPSHFMLRKPR